MARDRTAAERESTKHDHAHGHLEPTPHLDGRLDGHGSEVAHGHVHVRGGGNHYDHHLLADADHLTSDDDLKSDDDPADNPS